MPVLRPKILSPPPKTCGIIHLFPGKLRGRDERSVREYRMGLGSPKLLRDEDDPGPISSPGP
jgi:hypothetical protein